MVNWKKDERGAGRFLKELNVDEIYDQLDSIRGYLKDLADSFGSKTDQILSKPPIHSFSSSTLPEHTNLWPR